MYNCANVSICVVTAQCLSVHLCVCEYICLCVCQRAWELVCAVATRLHLPAIRPIAPHWRRSRDTAPAPGERAARCCHRRRAPLPFKSVSKPITADLPRDVLPSVSRSELPEDSPPDLPRVAPPQPAAGLRLPQLWAKQRVPGRPHGATLPGNVGGSRAFARPGGRR